MDKLGMEFVVFYWMYGVDNIFYGFLCLNDESFVVFVYNLDIVKIEF